MKTSLKNIAFAGALGFGLAACGNNNSGAVLTPQPPVTATQYTQIERLSRPAIKELFETFVNHQVSNAAEPYADATIQSSIRGFTDAVRPPNATLGTDYGAALAGVLYPDEYYVDLSAPGPASFLGADIAALQHKALGTAFGGRDINDNVITTELGVVFGNTLSTLGAIADDNEENNCLSNQNVTQASTQMKQTAFPYLPKPL